MSKEKTIRSSIRHGNMLILAGGLILTIFFVICLFIVHGYQQDATHYSKNLALTTEAIMEANTLYRKVDDLVFSNSKETDMVLENPAFEALGIGAMNDPEIIDEQLKNAQK